jgi:ABC-type antimicrobial peptide transport system permease subunit
MQGKWVQVAGVAKLAKYRNLTEVAKPFFYVPVRQTVTGAGLEIRTTLSADTLAKMLVREVHALDANLAPAELITMREQVDRMSWNQRAAVILLATFGGLALLLAAIGLYGVMSYAVSQSTRELGLRMALGAESRDLLKMVMSHGVLLSAAGVVVGGGAALGLTRLLGDLLYKVNPRDPAAFGVAFAVMAVASIAASLVPAWRASRTDPVRALRD